MEHSPLVLIFEKPKVIDPGRKSSRTTTIAKQQSRFKGDAIAEDDVFDQMGAKEKKMFMRKRNEKMINEGRPKRKGAFTPGTFFSIDGEYCAHGGVSSK